MMLSVDKMTVLVTIFSKLIMCQIIWGDISVIEMRFSPPARPELSGDRRAKGRRRVRGRGSWGAEVGLCSVGQPASAMATVQPSAQTNARAGIGTERSALMYSVTSRLPRIVTGR